MKIVALGDSTTAGAPGWRSPLEAPPGGEGDVRHQYGYWLESLHPEWTVSNRGVSGQTSGKIRRRFAQDVSAQKPDWVIVLAGVNDLYQGYPVSAVQEELGRIYDLAEADGIRVLACTILPFDFASPEVLGRIREVNDWIEREAARRGLAYCDTHRVLEDPARPGRLSDTDDGLHPNAEGYRKMGLAVAAALESSD